MVKDGLVLFYVKNDTLYPTITTDKQFQMLQVAGAAIFDDGIVKVLDVPQGKIKPFAKEAAR